MISASYLIQVASHVWLNDIDASPTWHCVGFAAYCITCNWLQNEWPRFRITLSGYFMSNSVFMPAIVQAQESLTFKDNCVQSNKHRPQRQKCWRITLVPIFNTKALLSQWKLRDAVVNFDTYLVVFTARCYTTQTLTRSIQTKAH